jgi:hypothetical protein
LTGAALRKAIMAIWCVCFCGMQWRAIGQLCDIPFGTLYTLFARWTRLWRRLLNRLIRAWRLACGDTADPSAVIIDSRSCQSAPTCFTRGFDGGKKIKGIKIHLAVDKYGFPLAITVSPANKHDSKGIVPVLHQLAGGGFRAGCEWKNMTKCSRFDDIKELASVSRYATLIGERFSQFRGLL